jgi:DNA repair exonuclease SbcCD ATPase subunit
MASESSSPPPVVLRPYISASSRIARKTHNEQFHKREPPSSGPSAGGLKSTLRIHPKSDPDDATDLIELKSLITEFEKKLGQVKLEKSKMVSQDQMEVLLDQFETIVGELEVARLESARYKREAGILTKALEHDKRSSNSSSNQQEELAERKKVRDEIERLRIIEHDHNSLKTQYEILERRRKETRDYENELVEERVNSDRLRHEKSTVENKLDSVIDDNTKLKSRLETVTDELIVSRKCLNEERDKHADQLGELAMKNGSLQKAITELQMGESRWKLKVTELEKLLHDSRQREEVVQGELNALRSNITGLDEEVRSMANALAAETQANENLQSRLDRVEGELGKSESELITLRRRDKDISSELSTLGNAVGDNQQLKNEVARLKLELADRDRRVVDMASSRDLVKRTMGGEIDRLQVQLDYTTNRSAALVEKYERLVREKDKMKSLLANDTLARMNRSVRNN